MQYCILILFLTPIVCVWSLPTPGCCRPRLGPDPCFLFSFFKCALFITLSPPSQQLLFPNKHSESSQACLKDFITTNFIITAHPPFPAEEEEHWWKGRAAVGSTFLFFLKKNRIVNNVPPQKVSKNSHQWVGIFCTTADWIFQNNFTSSLKYDSHNELKTSLFG